MIQQTADDRARGPSRLPRLLAWADPSRAGVAATCAIVLSLLLVDSLAGRVLDSAGYTWRVRLWERGMDLPLSYFYCSVVLVTFPAAALDIILSVFGGRLTGVSESEMGWRLPRSVLRSAIAALLCVPLLHVVICGVIPHARDIVFFQRLPVVSMRSDWTFSKLGNPQSVNRLVFSWSLLSVTEEVFFRGFIDTVLMKRFGRLAGILLGATLFALSHGRVRGGYQVSRLYDVWLWGFCFSCLRLATGSLMTPMIVHAGSNAIDSLFKVAYFMG